MKIKLIKLLRPIDFLVFFSVLVLGFFFTFGIKKLNGDLVVIQADKDRYEFKLTDEGIHEITGPIGITKVEIKDKKVRIIDSPCANKTCMSQGTHSPIVCLPNRVIVTIDNYGDFDAVAE